MKLNKLSKWLRNNKIKAFFVKIWLWSKNSMKVKYIFLVYSIVVTLVTIFLSTPITWNPEYKEKITFWDAFFTACSAFSDTGLVSHPTYYAWNMFGQCLIAISILAGGFGIFALKVLFINVIFMHSHMSLSDVELVAYERGNSDFFKNKKMITDSMVFLAIVLIISSFILSFYFYYVPPKSSLNEIKNALINSSNSSFISPVGNWSLSFRYGFFHSITAINNAGFDIIGDSSLMPYYKNIGLQIIFLILLIIGGIGYPVIHDIMNYIRVKRKNKKAFFNWSLFTKISTVTFFLATLIGFILVITFETTSQNSIFKSHDSFYTNDAYRVWSLFFMTVSTRSAGFTTFNLHHLSEPSLWILGILMFIGAAPASTGGGIRTTTFGILILAIISKILGRPSVRAFKRKIDDDTVRMSAVVSVISIILVITTFLITMTSFDNYGGRISSRDFNSTHIFFEVFSAFGTCGLSTGITSQLNIASKIAISILMFIGQFGISSSVLVWNSKKNYAYKYDFITESVTIG
ncbi:TrkH family potassium uptake protein [Mycoplasmopsis primatum]|uniref:TrkH family potassium uptake protein n=1 Tax=Mycoplasmopsis primatum TaxID=55604 RepID=UPI000496313D|nr:potassium transporter TrkG [Mycoplasmopsis primatum]